MKSAILNILGSSALSQIIIVATVPILTREYDQSEFGWFGVATTLSLLLSTCLTLRLETSIHTTPIDTKRFFSICLHTIVLLAAFILIPLLIVMPAFLVNGYGNLLLIALFSLFHAITICCCMQLNYSHRFRSIAITGLLVPIVFVAGAILFPKIDFNVNTLLFWQTIAYASGAIFSLLIQRQQISRIPLAEIKTAISLERENLQYLVPSGILRILSVNISVIGTTLLFDSAIAGLLVIAQRIARVPIGVIGNSFNEVLRSSIPTKSKIYSTYRTITISCVCASIIISAVVYMLPESAYGWILGSQWSDIKHILTIVIIGAGFQLISTSVFCLLTSFNKMADMLIHLALVASGTLVLLATYAFQLDPIQYLWIQTLLSAGIYSAGFLVARNIAIKESTD